MEVSGILILAVQARAKNLGIGGSSVLSKFVAQRGPLTWFRASVLTCSVFMLQTLGASLVVADPVNVRAWPHDGYGRLVFDWAQQVNFDINQSDSAVTINFTRPIEPNLTQVYTVMGDYLSDVSLGSDGRSISLKTSRPVTINGFKTGNRVVLDLRDTSGTALNRPKKMTSAPPRVSAAGQSASDSAVSGSADAPSAASTLDANALPFVRTRAGQHPTYNRLVFDWDQPVEYIINRNAEVLSIQFDKPARTNIESVNLSQTPFFAGPRQSLVNGNLNILVGVPQNGRIRDLRVGQKIVVDVIADQNARAILPPVESLVAGAGRTERQRKTSCKHRDLRFQLLKL